MTDTLVYNTFDTTGEEEARDVWRSLPIAEAYPIGSRWVHPSRQYPVTITGYRGAETVLVDYSEPEEGANEWPRTALDTYGRPARGDRDNAPAIPDEPEAGAFTRPAEESTPDVDTSFKAGDRVRITSGSGSTHGDALVGVEATYVGFSPYREPPFNPYEVMFDVGDNYGWRDGAGEQTHLYVKGIEHVDTTPGEPRAIAVGDRVRVTVDRDRRDHVGRSATVADLASAPGNEWARVSYTYQVRFDEDGHDLAGDTWWVQGVELLEDVSELATEQTETPELAPYPINAGDRVRLIDAGGDGGSEAAVGDLGTVHSGAAGPYDLLGVTMDSDGHRTSRNAHRWEKVTSEAAEPVTPVTYSQEDVDRLTREAADNARREGRQAATEEAARHLDRIVESAHEYARNNSLCSQFDRFMVENGLEPRDSWEGIEYEVSTSLYVTARSEEEAEETARRYVLDGNVSWEVEES